MVWVTLGENLGCWDYCGQGIQIISCTSSELHVLVNLFLGEILGLKDKILKDILINNIAGHSGVAIQLLVTQTGMLRETLKF